MEHLCFRHQKVCTGEDDCQLYRCSQDFSKSKLNSFIFQGPRTNCEER